MRRDRARLVFSSERSRAFSRTTLGSLVITARITRDASCDVVRIVVGHRADVVASAGWNVAQVWDARPAGSGERRDAPPPGRWPRQSGRLRAPRSWCGSSRAQCPRARHASAAYGDRGGPSDCTDRFKAPRPPRSRRLTRPFDPACTPGTASSGAGSRRRRQQLTDTSAALLPTVRRSPRRRSCTGSAWAVFGQTAALATGRYRPRSDVRRILLYARRAAMHSSAAQGV